MVWLAMYEPRTRDGQGRLFIPDLVLHNENEAFVIDPTVVFETARNTLTAANSHKADTYQHLEPQIRELTNCNCIELHGLAVGARGGWCRGNTKTLAKLGIK